MLFETPPTILPLHGPSLAWYLEAEEYLAEHIQSYDADEVLMFWQTPPTVIIGRHQDMEAEVNLAWCEEHNVAICRRKSGGGCVYSDEGNLMISLISKNTHSQEVFQDYLQRLVHALQQLGIDAVSTTHNDVLVGTKKVSGNACFATHSATIVHGTLLLNSNLDNVERAITPSKQKLAKHAVQSVRQRVSNLLSEDPNQNPTLLKALMTQSCKVLAPLLMREKTYFITDSTQTNLLHP